MEKMGPSSPKMGKMISDLVKDKESRGGEGRKNFGKYTGIIYYFLIFCPNR